MEFNDGEVADLLGRLSDAKSPSGFEDEVVDVVRDFCSGWAKVESNTVHVALITPNNFTGNKPVLMLDAHGDEVGGMVKSIRSNGTMTFVELGRFSPNVLAGQDVLVRNTLGEWVHGVIGVKPPHFVIFCNDARLFHFSYQRYLENCIRNVFGLEGTPVIMSIREKGDKED